MYWCFRLKIPLEIEVAPRYKLFTLRTLLKLLTLITLLTLFTPITQFRGKRAIMPICIARYLYDLISNCLLLHLEAGRNLETFIASTFGYKPSSSTDTNNRKTAIRTKLKSLSLFSGSEKSPRLPFSPPSPLSSSYSDSIVPFGAQPKFSLQGPPDCPLTHMGGAAELTTYKNPPSRWPQGRGTS